MANAPANFNAEFDTPSSTIYWSWWNLWNEARYQYGAPWNIPGGIDGPPWYASDDQLDALANVLWTVAASNGLDEGVFGLNANTVNKILGLLIAANMAGTRSLADGVRENASWVDYIDNSELPAVSNVANYANWAQAQHAIQISQIWGFEASVPGLIAGTATPIAEAAAAAAVAPVAAAEAGLAATIAGILPAATAGFQVALASAIAAQGVSFGNQLNQLRTDLQGQINQVATADQALVSQAASQAEAQLATQGQYLGQQIATTASTAEECCAATTQGVQKLNPLSNDANIANLLQGLFEAGGIFGFLAAAVKDPVATANATVGMADHIVSKVGDVLDAVVGVAV